MDSTYQTRIAQRRVLLDQHGPDLCDALPGSELALKELSEMVIQFLCARYPLQFQLKRTDDGRHVFHNNILRTSVDVTSTTSLEFLANNVPEDFVLMLRDPDTGKYRLRAGIICSAIGWNLGEKLDQELSDIHEHVPDYKAKMEKSMDRWFAKLSTEGAIQRGSWGWERGQMLYWSPEAGPVPGFDPCEAEHDENMSEEEEEAQVCLRIDWQTARRLPLTGAIAFNFKALFTPLPDIIKEPFVPALALKVLTDGKEHILKYKGVSRTSRVVKRALKRFAMEQVKMGMVPADWEVSTLNEAPFYPDWKASTSGI
jgi:Protein of unknown function (DUF3445)